MVDFVIGGEGEIPLGRLLDALRGRRSPEGIRGLWWLENGLMRGGGSPEIPDVASLPRPSYDLLEMERYFELDSPWHFPRSNRAVQFITQ